MSRTAFFISRIAAAGAKRSAVFETKKIWSFISIETVKVYRKIRPITEKFSARLEEGRDYDWLRRFQLAGIARYNSLGIRNLGKSEDFAQADFKTSVSLANRTMAATVLDTVVSGDVTPRSPGFALPAVGTLINSFAFWLLFTF